MPSNGTVAFDPSNRGAGWQGVGAVAPTSVIGTVAKKSPAATAPKPPRRRKNTELRTREYLTEAEIERLKKAARHYGRNGERNELLIALAYRHGLRVSELCALRWSQVDFAAQRLHVARRKGSLSGVHLLHGPELRLLRRHQRKSEPGAFLFMNERGTPMTEAGFRKQLARIGQAAGFAFGVHPHMLRHACGYTLANAGRDTRTIQDYLGHRNIVHTVRYTELAARRFEGLWDDD